MVLTFSPYLCRSQLHPAVPLGAWLLWQGKAAGEIMPGAGVGSSQCHPICWNVALETRLQTQNRDQSVQLLHKLLFSCVLFT